MLAVVVAVAGAVAVAVAGAGAVAVAGAGGLEGRFSPSPPLCGGEGRGEGGFTAAGGGFFSGSVRSIPSCARAGAAATASAVTTAATAGLCVTGRLRAATG
jgi:hypothetical protein